MGWIERLSRETFEKGRLLFEPKEQNLFDNIQYVVQAIGLDRKRGFIY